MLSVKLPPVAMEFNFIEQIGLGGTMSLDKPWLLMGGVRVLHMSNAGITELNPGVNAAMAYLGVMCSF